MEKDEKQSDSSVEILDRGIEGNNVEGCCLIDPVPFTKAPEPEPKPKP